MATPDPVLPAQPLGATTPKIDSVRQEVQDMLDSWLQIKDCIEGEASVKAAGIKYLPQPNAADVSEENKARYRAYVQRAVFYNVVGRTLNGLVGQAFALDPVVKLPKSFDTFKANVDGNGVSLNSQAQQTLSNVLAYGRGGILTDYPTTAEPLSVEEREKGEIRPTISLYSPFSIINWRTISVGAEDKLSLVVLREQYPWDDDGFEVIYGDQWRVMRLTEDAEGQLVYSIEVWQRQYRDAAGNLLGDNDERPIVLNEELSGFPTDAKGENLDFIPFKFIGALNNNPSPDNAPLYDMSVLNLAHYRNSADYEEACFIVGQPTVWMSGLTQAWIKDVFKEKPVALGSRAIIPLPVNAQAGLIQVNPNTMPKEAMAQKEAQMSSLGAKLVEPAQVQRTLGEARLEEATSSSILVSCVKNVMAAYLEALKWALLFHGESMEPVFELSTDFAISRLDPNERTAMMAEWVGGGITTKEYRDQLRKAGIAGDSDEGIERPKPVAPTDPTGGSAKKTLPTGEA